MKDETRVARKREIKLTQKIVEQQKKEAAMSVNDFLLQREIKLVNRNSIMHSTCCNMLKVALLGQQRIGAAPDDPKVRQM